MRYLIKSSDGSGSRTCGSYKDVYQTIGDILGLDLSSIDERTHMNLAQAEAWCELIGYEGCVYIGDGFTVEIQD